MELVGEEKKIQALFSELRLADERVMPTFATVLSRTQSHNVRPLRAFNLSFALATALLICARFSLAVWSWRWQQTPQPNRQIAATAATPRATPESTTTDEPLKGLPTKEQPRVFGNGRAARFAARQRGALLAARRAEIRDAAAISSWQSPTATLLSSQNDALLNSLPQLNESVKELKSFLPNK